MVLQKLGNISRDPRVRNAAWDFLEASDRALKTFPNGNDKDCLNELLRCAKGQIKAWRLWAIQEAIENERNGDKREKLKQQFTLTKDSRFGSKATNRKSSPSPATSSKQSQRKETQS